MVNNHKKTCFPRIQFPRLFLSLLFIAFSLLLSTCSQVFSKFDNPADPAGTNYQGYEEVLSTDEIKTFTPAAGSTLTTAPSVFIVSEVIGADAYHLQISSTPGFDASLILDKSNFSSNKMSPVSADLPLGKTYYWRARSHKAGTWGTWTVVSSFVLPQQYTVTYYGNSNTGGSVPVDLSTYLAGAAVTVLGNGSLTKTGYIFMGWNTEADESGTNRAVASTFTMGSANVSLYAKWIPIPVIGDTGPAGGLVFYDKGSYSSGWRFMEAAPSDQSAGIRWYNGRSYIFTGATAQGIGSGSANTATIVSIQGAGSYAASLCANLVIGGYDDWFLPSMDELNQMYQNLKVPGRGGFASAWYWGSSEYNNVGAYGQDFSDGFIGGNLSDYNKNSIFYVRAARAF